MANLTLIKFKQLESGVILSAVSGYALDATNQRLITTSGVLSGQTNSTGINLQNQINNLSGSGLVSFAQLRVSGSPLITGVSTISGFDTTVVFLSGNNTIVISGVNTGTFISTSLTGNFLDGNKAVTGIGITGSQTIIGLVNYTGYGGLVVLQSGQTVIFSGGAGGGVGNFSGLGIQGAPILTSGGAILSGLSGIVLSSGNPVNNVFGINIAQTAVSGLSFNSSNSVTGLVNINASSGLSVLANSNTFTFSQRAVSGLALSGDNSQTGLCYLSGVSGVTIVRNNNTFLISGGLTGAPGAVGATGPTSDAFFGINFFSDFVYTGLNIAESFVPRNIAYTGYSVGCINTGIGPLVFGLNTPLTGLIYMRGTGGEKTTLTQFIFQSGEKYQNSGNANVTISGGFRLGYDIINSLSGLGGFSLLIAGSGL